MSDIKRMVKALVPSAMVRRAVDTRNWIELATLRPQKFESGNLRAADTFRLQDIWTNEEVAASWEKDHLAIRELYGDENKMEGVNPGDRRALYYLIMALKPRSVLEVGTHIGASTLHIARALKRLNQDGRMTTVDIVDVNAPERGAWKKLGLKKPPAEFARELDCLDRIDFQTRTSVEHMRATRERYDLVFLDGYHGARIVYEEVSAALRLLRGPGVILLHDYYPDGRALYPNDAVIGGPFVALKRIRKENAAIDVLPLGDLPWPTKQGKNVTSLALVTRVAKPPFLPAMAPERDENRTRAASY